MINTIVYRVVRLRRLLALAIALPLVVIGVIWQSGGPSELLLPIAVLVPLCHVLRYPLAWMETLSVSVVLSILLALAATIGADTSFAGLLIRLFSLAALGFALLLISTHLIMWLSLLGPERAAICRASRWSALSPELLRERIPFRPGRIDDKVKCGPLTEGGQFSIRYLFDMADFETDHDIATSEPVWGKIITDRADLFEIVVVDPELNAPSSSRVHFEPSDGGTRVTMEEWGVPMVPFFQLGFWLQDYFTDYLIDEIDRVEGVVGRSNRSQPIKQLVVDIARMFAPSEPAADPRD